MHTSTYKASVGPARPVLLQMALGRAPFLVTCPQAIRDTCWLILNVSIKISTNTNG